VVIRVDWWHSVCETARMLADLRFAIRMLAKRPGFTLVAVFTLALGLSANATILGMIRVFFFQPLPVKDAERLVMVLQKTSVIEFPHGHSWLDYKDYRDRVPEFEDVLALFLSPVHLGIPGQAAERTWIEAVSGNYFTMLGVEAGLGRVFGLGDGERAGGEPMVVLAHRYWQTKFGADPGIIGRTVHLNGQPFSVIGVAPERFSGAQWSIAVSGWVPAMAMPQLVENGEGLLNNRGAPAFKVMARLRPGVSVAQARAAVDVTAKQLAAEYPQDHREATIIVVPEMRSRPEPSFSQFMPFAAAMFMALVVFVLLIACANVANLMFAHAIARRREMGIRAAMGATRWRLIRQILLESVIIAVAGGVLGDLLSMWTGALMSGFTPSGDLPIQPDTSWDWVSSSLILVLAVGAGMVTGLAPALRATRVDLMTVLKDGGGTAVGLIRHPLRSLLVVSQVALCVVVLVGGGLFLESLRQMARLDLGFRSGNLVMASLDLGLQRYGDERGRQFLHTLLERARALPGVESATVAVTVPFDYGVQLSDVGAEGQIGDGGEPGKDGYLVAGVNYVEAAYHRTLGVTILEGREFSDFDLEKAPKVAIVNQTLAERFWPGQSPVGKRFRFGRGGEFVEVVGLARDGKYVLLGEQPRPYVYVPLDQYYRSPATLHVRTAGDPLALVPALRRVLAELDPNLPIYNVRTMEEHLRQSAMAMMPLRMAAAIAGVQGALGLILAMMGIYGVVSYVANQRTREIGLRIALGARRLDVVRLVIREGWHLTLIGLGIGLGIAMVMALGLSRLLYGLNPFNVPVFMGVLLLLSAVALIASYLPARRAARVDPMEALRCE
jgi:predicted permease